MFAFFGREECIIARITHHENVLHCILKILFRIEGEFKIPRHWCTSDLRATISCKVGSVPPNEDQAVPSFFAKDTIFDIFHFGHLCEEHHCPLFVQCITDDDVTGAHLLEDMEGYFLERVERIRPGPHLPPKML